MKALLILAAVVGFATPAAAWDAIVDGPDVFGKTTVLAMDIAPQASLVLQCNSEGEVLLAFTYPKKAFEEVAEQQAVLYFTASDAEPMKLPATFRAWNDNYAGVVAALDHDAQSSVIAAIRNAKGSIKAGADISGNKISSNFTSKGSASAMKKVTEGCKIPAK